MTIAQAALAELKRRAREAATRAYAPYSHFPVGAAVLAADGTIHAGANVENASYGLSICAERAAIFHAVEQGTRKIEAIVIYTPTAKHGHFGRAPYEGQYYDRVKREHRGEKLEFFSWEKTDKAEALRKAVR